MLWNITLDTGSIYSHYIAHRYESLTCFIGSVNISFKVKKDQSSHIVHLFFDSFIHSTIIGHFLPDYSVYDTPDNYRRLLANLLLFLTTSFLGVLPYLRQLLN